MNGCSLKISLSLTILRKRLTPMHTTSGRIFENMNTQIPSSFFESMITTMQLTITASILALIVYGRLLWIDFDSDKYTRVHALIKLATLFVSMVLNFEAANTAMKSYTYVAFNLHPCSHLFNKIDIHTQTIMHTYVTIEPQGFQTVRHFHHLLGWCIWKDFHFLMYANNSGCHRSNDRRSYHKRICLVHRCCNSKGL